MSNTTEKKARKLSLTVSTVNSLESRSTPSTACPEGTTNGCGIINGAANAQKLTAVAFF